MHRYPSIEIIKAFTKEEAKRFRLFLQSAYFNKSSKLVQLYSTILSNIDLAGSPGFGKKELWEKLHQGGTYNDSTMRSLLADLHTLLKKFIIIENKLEETSSNRIVLLKYYLAKNLYGHFIKLIDSMESDQSEFEKMDLDEFYDYFQSLLLLHKYHTMLSGKFNKDRIKTIADSLDKSFNVLLIHLYYRLMLTEGDMVTLGNFFNYDISGTGIHSDYPRLMELDTYRNLKKNYKFGYLLNIFEAANRVIANNSDVEAFENLKAMVDENSGRIPKKQLFHLYKILMYFSDRQYEKGAETNRFLGESFEFNRRIVEQELYRFSDTGNIGYWRFRVSYHMGLKLGQFEWVENFIDKYSHHLFPEIRESMVGLAEATLLYNRGNLSGALINLAQISSANRLILLDIRLLYMQIYFDQGEMQQLEYTIQNYNQVNKREEFMSDAITVSLNNFVKHLAKLKKLRMKRAKQKAYDLLKTKIISEHKIYERSWLLERCKPGI